MDLKRFKKAALTIFECFVVKYFQEFTVEFLDYFNVFFSWLPGELKRKFCSFPAELTIEEQFHPSDRGNNESGCEGLFYAQ